MNYENGHENRRESARQLYTQYAKTAAEIALLLSVEEADVHEWIKEGSWEDVRMSLSISRRRQLEHLYAAVKRLNEEIDGGDADTKVIDKVLKYSAIIKNLETDTSLHELIESAELFFSWLNKRDRALTLACAREFDIFIRERKAA